MPSGTLRGKEIYQWAAESTKGTGLAATSAIVTESFDLEPEDAVYHPQFLNGRLLEHTGNEFVITRGTKWTHKGPASYEQLQHWFRMFIQGAVTPTGAGPYVWTFTRAPSTVPVFDSFTVERRLSDGANNIDNEWQYCMGSELKLSGQRRGVVMVDATGYARRIQSSTLTPALSLPTTELIPHGSSKLFLDSTWANAGVTQVVAQLLDWTLTIKPGTLPLFTADGRTDLDFGTDVINGATSGIQFQATLLIPGTSSQYATEKTAAEASTLRAARLQTVGTSSRDLKIDFLCKHNLGSLFKIGEIDGQDVVAIDLVTSTDGTNFLKAVLTNNVSAFA